MKTIALDKKLFKMAKIALIFVVKFVKNTRRVVNCSLREHIPWLDKYQDASAKQTIVNMLGVLLSQLEVCKTQNTLQLSANT